MKRVLTAKFVASVLPPAKGRAEYTDAALPGFTLRVTADGQKSFSLRYRSPVEKVQRRRTWTYPIVSLATARSEARAAMHEIGQGKDPALVDRRASNLPQTVAELCDLYVEQHLKKYNICEQRKLLSNQSPHNYWEPKTYGALKALKIWTAKTTKAITPAIELNKAITFANLLSNSRSSLTPKPLDEVFRRPWINWRTTK